MADMDDTGEHRAVLGRVSTWAMYAGLVGGYGALAAIAGRFLFPSRPARRAWMFVTEVEGMGVGDAVLYRGPSGETINVARQARNGSADDFIALSSTCPHLGCQVHWEAHNDRFFCPCHNGVFDPAGRGVSGPPGDAGLDLPRYPLKVEGGLLYIELPTAFAGDDPAPDRHAHRDHPPAGGHRVPVREREEPFNFFPDHVYTDGRPPPRLSCR